MGSAWIRMGLYAQFQVLVLVSRTAILNTRSPHIAYEQYIMYNMYIMYVIMRRKREGIIMTGVSHPATKVRQEFADFLDDARLRPQYIKRRNYQYIVVPADTFETLVPLTVSVKDQTDEDGSHFTENNQFPDVIGFGATAEEAFSSFKEGLAAYSYEYYERFSLFSMAPGRAEQAPMILRLVSHYERYGNLDSIVKAS